MSSDRDRNGSPSRPGRRRLLPLAASIAAAILATGPGPGAQAPSGDSERAQGPIPQAARLTGERTPADVVKAYITACRQGDFERAASYLDLAGAGVDPEQGPTRARHLKVVLDRKVWIHFAQLSREPEGDTQDGLPAGVDRLGRIAIPDGPEVDVLVEREADGLGGGVWRFSAATVGQVPALYEEYGYGPLGEILPEPMFRIRFLEIGLWQWIGLVLVLLVSYLLSWLVTAVIYRLVRTLVQRTETEVDDLILLVLTAPLRFATALAFFSIGSLALFLAVPVQQFLYGLERALAVVAVSWIAMRVVDVFAGLVRERLLKEDRRSVASVVPLGRRTVKAFLLVIATIAMLQNLGVNVTGLIAGLGVGGIAVALAAQKTIENLFGGVSMIADQPVRVGDFCRFSDNQVGTIEEIGLRSTRVRTLDRTVVTIPNSDFSQRPLENFAARDKIRLVAVLGLRYETTPDQMRWVLTELRKLLISHPRVSNEPARVRFVNFGAHSLDVEVFAYVETSDFNEFLGLREDLYLRMMDIVERSGSGFAFPSQTLYLGRDGGLDAERTAEAERSVQAWRERGELPFPNLSPEVVAELDDTADFPPRGSVG